MAEGMNWPQRLLAAQEALLAAEKRAEEAEGEVERLRTDLMVASQELDAAGCQVAASDAHRATFGETK